MLGFPPNIREKKGSQTFNNGILDHHVTKRCFDLEMISSGPYVVLTLAMNRAEVGNTCLTRDED